MVVMESPDSQRVLLGTWPTPLEPAPRLARAIGLEADDLWVKRDDLTGLGAGGNKVRKLEWTCGAALADNATVLVTTGSAQSNHVRLTAAAGARLGLDVVVVLSGSPGGSTSGNLALDGLFGARVVWAGDVDRAGLIREGAAVVDGLRGRGARAALIPFGGSSVLAARGYVECGREILDRMPDVAHIVVALGSGGTMAGLVAASGPERVLGVHCGALDEPAREVADLVARLVESAPDPGGLRVREDQVGDGYATLTEPVMAALTLAARTEGIVLDPVYTGRALAGLIAAVADGDVRRGERTVLLHTGGLPGFFGHPEAVARAQAGLGVNP